MCVLALDLGATFIKGARVRPIEGLIERAVRRPFPAFLAGLPAGRREVPLDGILAAARSVLNELLREGPPPRALFLCGQMHGLVLIAPDGAPLSDFSSWQDGRALEPASGESGSCFDNLRKRLGPRLITELGNELQSGFPLAKLYAMAAHGELPPRAVPLSLPDYIALTLCNQLGRPKTDATNAAAHGAFNVAKRAWHREVLRQVGLDHLNWPEILPSGAYLGDLRHSGWNIPVHVPVGDQQAALLGVGLADDELSLNIATGSQVSALAAEPSAGDWQLRPFFGERWLRTITHLPAGRALNALIGLLAELPAAQGTPLRDPWKQIERLATESPAPRLRANLAFFPSAVGDKGSLEQLTENELRVGPLFRAAFESMAANYLSAARRVAPKGWSRVVFSGGLVQKSAVLKHEILKQLGPACRMPPEAEDTLAGLMHLARQFDP